MCYYIVDISRHDTCAGVRWLVVSARCGVTTTTCTASPGRGGGSAATTPSTWTSTAAKPAAHAATRGTTGTARTSSQVAISSITRLHDFLNRFL